MDVYVGGVDRFLRSLEHDEARAHRRQAPDEGRGLLREAGGEDDGGGSGQMQLGPGPLLILEKLIQLVFH